MPSSSSSSSSQSCQALESVAEAYSDDDEQANSPFISINTNTNSGTSVEEGQGESNGDYLESPNVAKHRITCNCEDNNRARVSSRKRCRGKDIDEEEQEYFQQILGSSSVGWTDEKHSSYLDFMEADFMRSIMFDGNLYATHNQATDPTSITQSSDLVDCASSQQARATTEVEVEFKAWQNGGWRPVSLQAPYIGPLIPYAVAFKNPWMKHFRPRRNKSPSSTTLPMRQTLL